MKKTENTKDIDIDKRPLPFNKNDFANAVKSGNAETVEHIIKIICEDKSQLTDFLKEASYDPSYPAVKYKKHPNNSALASGARSGHAEVIKLLLDAGKTAKVITQMLEECGIDALQNAAIKGHEKVVKFLLDASREAGLLKEMLDPLQSAFILAAENDHLEVVKFLLDAAKDAKVVKEMLKCNGCWYSPIVFAAHKGNLGTLKLLLDAAEEAGVTNDMRLTITASSTDLKYSTKLIIYGNIIGAVKEMVKTGDLEGARSLVELYPSCKEVAEPYLFDPEGLKDLLQFSKISAAPLKSFKVHQKDLQSPKIPQDLMKVVASFLVGVEGKYIPHMLKAFQGMKNYPNISKDFDGFMEKYEHELDYSPFNPLLDCCFGGYNIEQPQNTQVNPGEALANNIIDLSHEIEMTGGEVSVQSIAQDQLG